jgi:hypothetical protein
MDRPDKLIDALRDERIERAKRMDPAQKAIDGPRLFEWACRITMDGIRAQYPEADEADVRRILRERLVMRRAQEDVADGYSA